MGIYYFKHQAIFYMKALRAANYHEETIDRFLELVAASGLESPHNIKRTY